MEASSLEEFYSESLAMDDDSLGLWSSGDFCTAKLDVVASQRKALAWAEQIPRRIGGGATGAQLSADKKFMRMMMHLMGKMYDRWLVMANDPVPIDLGSIGPNERKAGAQMQPLEFLRDETYTSYLQIRSVATICTQLGLEVVGLQIVNNLLFQVGEMDRIRSRHNGRS